ncbi:sporulation peptidase YabG [Candidatus Contubernalis alkaliaceticus]|uniref:sporulation peptidase YabG n=1 Tax=Candidatus Contubernalis alkaliaceticus TaxID=338645 RepID=UPI001F4C085B|nr:sporulation peptidase YabG [Candidatus Contubernalis alkalaceticus]UNC90685.1 sporulation peptidase YabG [Candidatus Contubernalis alkalaceticus]
MDLKVGDIVCRRSYGGDVVFKIIEINWSKKTTLLKGVHFRLMADAPIDDLYKPESQCIQDNNEKYNGKARECINRIYKTRSMSRNKQSRGGNTDSYYEIPGKILHIDGDQDYLEECMKLYKNLEISAQGVFIPEKKQPDMVENLLRKNQPDILVLTGHDAILKGKKNYQNINNYRNSKYFVRSTIIARNYEPGKDSLIIFAGACQSHYEELMAAGANFASSPQRVLISALDPVFIVEKIAYTSFKRSIKITEVINNTITGIDGLGGIETKGTFRFGFPKSPY